MFLIDTPAPVPSTGITPDYTGVIVTIIIAVLTIGSSIVIAVVRKPAAYSELWAENRARGNDLDVARAEMRAMETRHNTQLGQMEQRFTEKLHVVVVRQQVIGDGFVALSNGIERARVKPILLPGEQDKIDAARQAIATDLDWPTLTPEGAPS